MTPIIIDVESSGTGPGSYPVEIGLAMPDGKTHCFLIKPASQWLHWDKRNEQVHHISQATLVAAGKDVGTVALALNSILKGEVAFCEKWGMAITWMSLLYYTARVPQMFTIESLHSLARQPKINTWNALRQTITEEISPQRRRASTDALILQKTYTRSQQAR